MVHQRERIRLSLHAAEQRAARRRAERDTMIAIETRGEPQPFRRDYLDGYDQQAEW